MLTAFLWTLRLFTGLVVLSVLALVIFYWFLSRSLPDYNESFTLPGINQPVEIVRNNNNVPHIFAKTDKDAYFALGFVHAQDRLWQMTMLRRTAQGRLSEIFGARTLKIDELIPQMIRVPEFPEGQGGGSRPGPSKPLPRLEDFRDEGR